MSVLINASTSSGLTQTADNSGTLELQSGGTTQLTVSSTGAYGQIKSGTAVASTSGTSIDFTGLPSWIKRITVMFQGVSTNGSSPPQIQIGSGSVTTSGYLGSNTYNGGTVFGAANFTAGFGLGLSTSFWGATALVNGAVVLTLQTGNTWVATGSLGRTDSAGNYVTNGLVALGGALDRVRITMANGTDAFDAGSINILYEG
jgi:hypothetical protein